MAQEIPQDRWRDAYLSEIDRVAAETEGRTLSTVFFGGGTPSLMDPEVVSAILDRVQRRWPMVNDPEITLEANPSSVESGRFQAYRDAGVTRVSIGVQALNDADLRKLGRLHSARDARIALDVAKDIFERVSFDLIYARQGQSLADWRDELTEAVSLAADHLSLYQLTIEPGTAFGARHAAGGLPGLPNEDLSAEMYAQTQEICEAAGFRAYEISNHARGEAMSRHNLIYWRQGDYAGIGPGAHGRMTFGSRRFATETDLVPGKWLSTVETSGSGEAARFEVPDQDRAEEYLMMSMRLSEGMDINRFCDLGGRRLRQDGIAGMAELGLIKQEESRLRATGKGRPVLNAILRELMVD